MITQYSYGECVCKSNKPNVLDYYQKWKADEIRADLQKRRTDAIMIFDNIDYSINIGCGIRSNNAFLGKAVYVCGRRKYDKRSAAGTNHYENVYHADTVKEVIDHVHSLGYIVYAIDNIMEYDPINLLDVALPRRSAFVFGQEGAGLDRETIDLCDNMLFIGMYGSVRSLNVAVAAGIVQYEYTRQWRNQKEILICVILLVTYIWIIKM